MPSVSAPPKLYGPFDGPYGEPLTFLVCTEGERLTAIYGPFATQVSHEIYNTACNGCANAHFVSHRIPLEAPLRAATQITQEEEQWCHGWVRAWWELQRAELGEVP